jgi:hypothetical protein
MPMLRRTTAVRSGSKATAEVGPEPEPMSAPLPKAAVLDDEVLSFNVT